MVFLPLLNATLVIRFIRRFDGLELNPEVMEEPKGFIRFVRTDPGEGLVTTARKWVLILYGVAILQIVLAYAEIWSLPLYSSGLLFLFIGTMFLRRFMAISNIPVMVDVNHPWMLAEPIGQAQVRMRTGEGWIDPKSTRPRIARDPVTKTYNWVSDVDNSIMGTYSGSRSFIALDQAILKQALIARDLVNGTKDDFKGAREREDQESGLLEREWIEEAPEEIGTPFLRWLNRSE